MICISIMIIIITITIIVIIIIIIVINILSKRFKERLDLSDIFGLNRRVELAGVIRQPSPRCRALKTPKTLEFQLCSSGDCPAAGSADAEGRAGTP